MQVDTDNARLRELISAAQLSGASAQSPDAPTPPKPKRTRRRIPVSCGLCHSRKLKCNRQKPCTSCEIRGEGSKCEYATDRQDDTRPWSSGHGGVSQDQNGWHAHPQQSQYRAPEPPQMIPSKRLALAPSDADIQQRLDNIERLVADAANTRQQSSYPTPEDDPHGLLRAALSPPRSSIGTLEKHLTGSTYAGDTAFDGILHEIGELRSFYAQGRDEYQVKGDETRNLRQPGSPPTFRTILAGANLLSEPQMDELLHALPPKATSDGLLARFFSNDDPAIPVNYVLHQATFMDEYQQHCEDPSHTSVVWLGILFSVLCLSSRFYECEFGSSVDYRAKSLQLSEDFYGRAAQCLAKIDASVPTSGTVEFNALFVNAAYFRHQENSSRVWLIAGDAVRLAMRMGYHRDPASYSQFTPFEIEMRRRLWHFIAQTDLLFSFQLGLPTVVRAAEYDTLAPQNFHEDQLHPAMQELPPPRPADEPTHISYMIANVSILSVFRSIVEHSNSLQPTTYDQVLALNHDLVRAHALIPPHLQRSKADSQSLPTNLNLKRIQLDLFYHKIMCVLHRKYMNQGITDPKYQPSMTACVHSALALLECQRELHSNERALWKQIRWHSFSLTNHDFILAATILCFYVTAAEKVDPSLIASDAGDIARPTRAEIQQALDASMVMWSEVRGTSKDAGRAFEILDRMLSHRTGPAVHPDQAPQVLDPALQQAQSGNTFNNDTVMNVADFDWEAWDAYFREEAQYSAPTPAPAT